jgi:hypothetical protein
MKVALLGLEGPFASSIQTMLQARGMEALLGSKLVQPGRHIANLRWMLNMDVVHYLQGGLLLRYHWARVALGRPVVVHWSGSDILHVLARRGFGGTLLRWSLRHSVTIHLADSPDLAREAAPLAGYEPQVIRLLPVSLKGQVLPLPERFTVLSYWRRGREDFYGRQTVLHLARTFPQVAFIVVVDDVPPRDQWPANVTYLPIQSSLGQVWPQVSCLVRVLEHDSLSAMVLEALSRGRYAIYSKEFPHTILAANNQTAAAALQNLLTRRQPNLEGAAYVNEHFDPEAEVDKLVAIYERILKRPRGNTR